MSTVTAPEVVGQLLAVLGEAFEGSQQPSSYFTDGPADTALLGTLAKLSAKQASQPVGGTSVAAHVHHVTFGLGASIAWIGGDRSPRDWQESWQVKTVDDKAWTRLQGQLRDRYQELRQAINARAAADAETFRGALGAFAHVVYHLGAIRQKIACAAKGRG